MGNIFYVAAFAYGLKTTIFTVVHILHEYLTYVCHLPSTWSVTPSKTSLI